MVKGEALLFCPPAAGTWIPRVRALRNYIYGLGARGRRASGVGADVALERVKAACVLGLKESTKVASAHTQAAALDLRALEICQAAGFPVDWSKV